MDEDRRYAHFGAAAFDVVVVAASLGGIRALPVMLAALPPAFPASVLIVQHRALGSGGLSAWARASRLPVTDAVDGGRLRAGRVVVAPPGAHLELSGERILRLSNAAPVNFVRPAADVLFASAARVFGPRVLGVVMTGRFHDGAEGARAIHASGGMVLAQDPLDSEAPDMPRAAIATGCVDHVLPLRALADAVVSLVMVPGAAGWFGQVA